MLTRDALLLRFEALGDNCEFGLVQRQGGAEPLGLLRFAGFYIPIEHRLARLRDALDSRFEGLGRLESVRVEPAGPDGEREYLVWEDAFGLMYHSFQAEGSIEPEVLRGLEARKLGFLRRKFLDDLATGEKILVWKSNLPQPQAEIERLAERLRQFGRNTLLWVEEAGVSRSPGTAEVLESGLLKGYVERFAPYDTATDISYESWFSMCAEAYRLSERPAGAGKVNVLVGEPANMVEIHPDLQGEDYLAVLRRCHAVLRPQTYLEIGSRDGDSLSLAECPSIAIDPGFRLCPQFLGNKRVCSLYQLSSDRFFESFDPKAILGREVDFAFLDGMHLAEFLVRDFANTERACRKNSIIVLHDCVPVEAAIARRNEADFQVSAASAHPHWWTGDVWKVPVLLKKFRPDLSIHAFDAAPTGLIMITNLDPSSSVLLDNYENLLTAIRKLDLTMFGIGTYIESLNLTSTQHLRTLEDFSRYFWL